MGYWYYIMFIFRNHYLSESDDYIQNVSPYVVCGFESIPYFNRGVFLGWWIRENKLLKII